MNVKPYLNQSFVGLMSGRHMHEGHGAAAMGEHLPRFLRRCLDRAHNHHLRDLGCIQPDRESTQQARDGRDYQYDTQSCTFVLTKR